MFRSVIITRSLLSFLCCITLCFAISLSVVYEVVSTTSQNRLLPIYSVETEEKKIAITFDAAWSAEDTDDLIAILKKHAAKATFFVVGDWVVKNPEAVKKLFDNGHEIGNHSDTHPAYSRLSREEIKTDIIN